MSKTKFRETMRAEMKPDMYGGKECNQMEPRWWCYAEGDKDGDFNHEPLTLDAQLFPPGTKISIQEPVCPKCEETREPISKPVLGGPTFPPKCRCGFDWEAWTADQYA